MLMTLNNREDQTYSIVRFTKRYNLKEDFGPKYQIYAEFDENITEAEFENLLNVNEISDIVVMHEGNEAYHITGHYSILDLSNEMSEAGMYKSVTFAQHD